MPLAARGEMLMFQRMITSLKDPLFHVGEYPLWTPLQMRLPTPAKDMCADDGKTGQSLKSIPF